MSFERLRAWLDRRISWVVLIFLVGVGLRVNYSLRVQPPQSMLYSDMSFYVSLAERLRTSSDPLKPWDVTHPLGYPALLAFLRGADGSLARAAHVQLVVSCLVPLALGLLGTAAFGRRTGALAIAFASLYFPFIEFGAYFLTEIHFTFWITLAFSAFLAARDAERRGASLACAAAGGVALSIAITLKQVGFLAAVVFFAADAVGLLLARAPQDISWRARLRSWPLRVGIAAAAALPLLAVLASACMRATGKLCLTVSQGSANFLLGHYGRIADITWAEEQGHGYGWGSPSSYLRHYDVHERVPFPITDGAANSAEAWRWIFAHPFEAFVLTLDHVWDTFFGMTLWPTFNGPRWMYAQLSQYVFVALLFVPAVLACAKVGRLGVRAAIASRTALVLSPILAVVVTVAVATGEVRYRIPFDVFFIVAACALATRDVDRRDVIAGASARRSRVADVAEYAIQS
jgi:4-amino-4-deoxy-L-arabinose transferase-like glycosyltransferase